MRRSFAYPFSLILIGAIFAITLFKSASLSMVWRKDSLLPIEGESISVAGHRGALEFENADVFFFTKPRGGLFWNDWEPETHQPFWLPALYDGGIDINTAWQLKSTRGFRLPLWPFLAFLLIAWLRPKKKRR